MENANIVPSFSDNDNDNKTISIQNCNIKLTLQRSDEKRPVKISGFELQPDCTIKVEIIDGKKEGEAVVYSSRKIRIANLNFLHDQLHGQCYFHDDSGKLQKEAYYEHGVLRYVDYYENGKELHKYELYGTLMKEYEMRPDKVLVYEGAYKGDIDNGFVREGSGRLYSEGLTIGTFENNQIVSIQNIISESTLYKYAEGKIVYIGEYEEKKEGDLHPRGKGVEFTYENETISSAHRVVDGDRVSLYLSFPTADTMCEYNEDGAMVYEGGFSKNKRNMFIRCGKGKELDNNNKPMYDGEWQENERCGKGLYYVDGIPRFEGEWKHGYPVSGKYLDEKGKTLVEGEWDHGFYLLDGKIYLDYRDGQKVSIDEDYQVIFKGEWKDGKPHGQGSYYENGGLKYYGVWTEGRLNVKDSLWFDYASRMYVVIEMGKEVYRGEWKDDKPNGIGSYYENGQEKYRGTWQDGLFSIGYYVFFDFADRLVVNKDSEGNVIYRGEWKDGKPHGQGRYYENGRVKYSGEWRYGKLSVSNSLWFDYASKEHVVIEMGKEVYRGEWHNGKPHGEGCYYENGQEKYSGTWQDGLFSIGDNVFFNFADRLVVNEDSEGNLIYRGEWKDGEPHGEGSYYESGIVKYSGTWRYGKLRVSNSLWFDYASKEHVVIEMGKEVYRGEWHNFKPHGEGCYYENGEEKYRGTWQNGVISIGYYVFFDFADRLVVDKDSEGNMIYRGEWKDGEPHGQGRYYENGRVKYRGTWENGLFSIGDNVFFNFADRLMVKKDSRGNEVYRGQWNGGKPHGEGKYFENGEEKYHGKWTNGFFHVKGPFWFNFVNGKEERIVPMTKEMIPKFMKDVVSIEEVTDSETSMIVMGLIWACFIAVVIKTICNGFVTGILLSGLYYVINMTFLYWFGLI